MVTLLSTVKFHPLLGLLTNLTSFGTAATGLLCFIPVEIGNVIKLENLSLYGTDVSGSISPELGACSELSNLYLHLNKLTGSVPLELDKLQKLSHLVSMGEFYNRRNSMGDFELHSAWCA